MGEAKRRREANSRTNKLPDGVKDAIAMAAQSIVWPIGGTCWYRAGLGYAALKLLGLPVQFQVGSMVYRAGPDPDRDVVAFCGPGNMGAFVDGHHFLGHVWLKSGDDLVDFTVGEWRHLQGRVREYGADLGEIVWTAPQLPAFFWQPQIQFTEPWRRCMASDARESTTPALGQAWYGPMAVGKESAESVSRRLDGVLGEIAQEIRPYIPLLKSNIENMRIRERISEAAHEHTRRAG